jgi:alpha-tubulin suppressor-like RCC1 family protein
VKSSGSGYSVTVVLAILGTACSSNGSPRAGTGGALGTGGTSSQGGTTADGGQSGTGGGTGSGGTTSQGGTSAGSAQPVAGGALGSGSGGTTSQGGTSGASTQPGAGGVNGTGGLTLPGSGGVGAGGRLLSGGSTVGGATAGTAGSARFGSGGSGPLGGSTRVGSGGATSAGSGGSSAPGSTPEGIPTLGFRQVSAGFGSTCGLRTDDGLWCWGARITMATRMDVDKAWKSVSVWGPVGYGITKDGALWSWNGAWVETRVGKETDWKEVSTGPEGRGCGLRGTGTLWCWENGAVDSPPVAVGQASDWTGVSVGQGYTCGLRTPGSLWCWGRDSNWGQLGLGPQTSSEVPARVGSEEDWTAVSAYRQHTCGIRRNGTIWCWGYNGAGQLGGGTLGVVVPTPTQVGARNDWVSISVGMAHTCAARGDKTVWCWGNRVYGQVDQYQDCDTEPTQVGSQSDWIQVDAGGSHTCGVRSDSSVWCWGNNSGGQLGIGSMPIHDTMTQVGSASDWDRVTSRRAHVCGLRAGKLWCWGDNSDGKLGDGTTTPRQEPTRVGTADDWTAVTTGVLHTCGLRADRSLWCWGQDGGLLGIGRSGQADASMFAATPQRVGADNSWLAVDANYHSCAIAADRSLWCWGQNKAGVGSIDLLTVPTRFGSDNDWIAIALDEAYGTYGLRADHSVWYWGPTMSSQPTQIGNTGDWQAVSARWRTFCGIKIDGSLWCSDSSGSLEQRGSAVDWIEALPYCGLQASGTLSYLGMSPIPGTDWKTMDCSETFIFGVKKNGTLWSMGASPYGQMGDGNAWRNQPARVLMAPTPSE